MQEKLRMMDGGSKGLVDEIKELKQIIAGMKP
jgi:hypothetical protein